MTTNALSLMTYSGHSACINALSWSPDNKYLASASNDGTVQIWDATTGEQIQIYQGHDGPVEAVVWSPRDPYIASGGWDKTVQVWHAVTGEKILIYYGHTAWIRSGLSWSPDGLWIASGGWDKTVQIWRAMTGQISQIYRGHESIVTSLSWSPDGSQIASGGGCPVPVVHVWDVLTGAELARYHDFKYSLRTISWCIDGVTIVLGGFQEDVRRWKPATGEILLSYGYSLGHRISKEGKRVTSHDYCISGITFSPDRKYFAAGLDMRGISIWKVDTGENIAALSQPSDVVSWSLDGTRIASAYHAKNTVNVWQISLIKK